MRSLVVALVLALAGCGGGGAQVSDQSVAVRLLDGDGMIRTAPPGDELTTGVDELVALVGGLDEADSTDCNDEGGPHVVFSSERADGSSEELTYADYGCRWLHDGETRLEGGAELMAAYAARLLDQRATRTPPGAPAAQDCDPDAASTPLVVDPRLRLASAAVCGRGGVPVALSPEQVAVLADGMTRHDDLDVTGSPPGCGRHVTVTGWTDWGDPLLLGGDLCWLHVAHTAYRLSDEAAAVLRSVSAPS